MKSWDQVKTPSSSNSNTNKIQLAFSRKLFLKSKVFCELEKIVTGQQTKADKEVMSEESEDDGAGESREEMIYRRKYQMLLERCEVLQQDNERLVNRIQQVYKFTRQVRKERKFLMDRLDNYGDNWRQGITQYYYENAQPNKSSSKLKHHPQNSEKRAKRSLNSSKKSVKEKPDSDVPARKHSKESGGKNTFKNLPAFNYI